MGQKTCDQCGESVDEAKAFCPACGEALVQEEQRKGESAFELMDSTVRMGDTMYGQMLTDMGLNISKAPDKDDHPPQPEKRIEVIAPIAPPAADVMPRQQKQAETAAKKNYLIWIIVGAAALILLLALLVVAAAIVIFYLNR